MIDSPVDPVRYVLPDGRLTPEGMQLFLQWFQELQALRTAVDDHEARLVVLEP